jgi:L-ectoine synthase
MIVRDVKDIIGTDRDVTGNGWQSRRVILARDGLKYSVHETIIEGNQNFRFHYKAHRETVYCIEGEGSVENVSTGEETPLNPGCIYSAGIDEEHVLKTLTRMKLLCIFDPPLHGQESAD